MFVDVSEAIRVMKTDLNSPCRVRVIGLEHFPEFTVLNFQKLFMEVFKNEYKQIEKVARLVYT